MRKYLIVALALGLAACGRTASDNQLRDDLDNVSAVMQAPEVTWSKEELLPDLANHGIVGLRLTAKTVAPVPHESSSVVLAAFVTKDNRHVASIDFYLDAKLARSIFLIDGECQFALRASCKSLSTEEWLAVYGEIVTFAKVKGAKI